MESEIIQTLILDRIHIDRIGFKNLSQDCNLLWKVAYVPSSNQSRSSFIEISNTDNQSCSSINNKDTPQLLLCRLLKKNQNSYLFAIDDGEGYRLNWICYDNLAHENDDEFIPVLVQSFIESHSVGDDDNDGIWHRLDNLVTEIPDGITDWQRCYSDRITGTKFDESIICNEAHKTKGGAPQQKLDIAFSAYLSIIVLLQDILVRYPKLSKSHTNYNNSTTSVRHEESSWKRSFPDYTYELVSVTDGGRMIELLLAFSVSGKKMKLNNDSCKKTTATSTSNHTSSLKLQQKVGVFLVVDVLTSQYKELKWIRNSFDDSTNGTFPSVSILALNRRQSQVPWQNSTLQMSSVHSDNNTPATRSDTVVSYTEKTSLSLSENTDSDIKKQQDKERLMRLPLRYLYPDCETIDNWAVRKQRPVPCMKARYAPVELIYG